MRSYSKYIPAVTEIEEKQQIFEEPDSSKHMVNMPN